MLIFSLLVLTQIVAIGVVLYYLKNKSMRAPRFGENIHNIRGEIGKTRFKVITISVSGMRARVLSNDGKLDPYGTVNLFRQEEPQQIISAPYTQVEGQTLDQSEFILRFDQPLLSEELWTLIGSGIDDYIELQGQLVRGPGG